MHPTRRAQRMPLSGAARGITLAVAGALAAGCTPSPGPTPTAMTDPTSPTTVTSTSTNPSPTSTNTPTVPIPEKAHENTRDGATQFADFMVSEVNRAYRQADPTILDRVFSPECPVCATLRSEVTEIQELGQHYDGDSWVVTSIYIETWSPDDVRLVVEINQENVDIIDASGRKVNYQLQHPFRWLATLAYDQGWTVARLQELDP